MYVFANLVSGKDSYIGQIYLRVKVASRICTFRKMYILANADLQNFT